MSYFNSTNGTHSAVPSPLHSATPSADQHPISVSFFKNEKDKLPQQLSLTWKEFCAAALKEHRVRIEKTGGSAWSPVSYKADATRGIAGVQEIYCAVFDIEHQGNFELVRHKLSGLAFAAHSSFRHAKDDPRYRIVIPLKTPVLPADWPMRWEQLNQWLGGINDPATKDASRLYYLPSKPHKAEDHFIEFGEGSIFDVSELPDLPIKVKAQVQSTAKYRYNDSLSEWIEEGPKELGPEAGLQEVSKRCVFMRHVSKPANQDTVSYPTWRAMISNAACFENSDSWIHQASCHHSTYSENETNKNIRGFKESGFGPITCKTIQDAGFDGCPHEGCKLPSGGVTKAPAGLWTWCSKKNVPTDLTKFGSEALNMPPALKGLLDTYFPLGLYYTNETFYAYVAGVWVAQHERSDIRRKIAEYLGESAKKNDVENLLSLLKDFQATREVDLNQNKHLICLKNGTLNTNSYELIDHSPSHGLMSKTDIEWDPNANCARWLQFLNEIFANDIDKAQKIGFVQEWFGYCLVPDSSQQKFVWMVGAGGNGKSVLLAILTQLVGFANVSNAHIERLDEKYVRAELEGKLVNISSEMSASATISDGYLKAIVAGDIVEAERKYKPSFSFRPFVRLIGATNNLPRLLDHSQGFARRAIILEFNRKFAEHEQDLELEQKLQKEFPGILAWAVAGLIQLRERKRFEVPHSSITALTKYRNESDPVHLFFEECLERTNDGGISPMELYQDYQLWSRQYGFAPLNNIRFGRRLAEIIGGDCKRRSAGKDYWLVKSKLEYQGQLSNLSVTYKGFQI